MRLSARALGIVCGVVVAAASAGCSATSGGATTDGGSTSIPDTCSADTSVTCMQGAGWSCTGNDTPQLHNPLVCSTATTSGTKAEYCCVSSTGVSTTCAVDAAVTCTQGTGFTCTGTDSPSKGNANLACTGGTGDAGNTAYCCTPYTSSMCMQDSTVMGCTNGSYGFSCIGSNTPSTTDSALNCSTGTAAGNGATLYCCQ